jgi:hypothetical protein
MSKTTDKKAADIFERMAGVFGKGSEIVPKETFRFCAFPKGSQIHFELSHSENTISIEFHLEKWDESKAQNERARLLRKLLKRFTKIFIFDKQMTCDLKHGYGRLYLKFDCSETSEDEMSFYIYEFIYQIKSRIDMIIPNWNQSHPVKP